MRYKPIDALCPMPYALIPKRTSLNREGLYLITDLIKIFDKLYHRIEWGGCESLGFNCRINRGFSDSRQIY